MYLDERILEHAYKGRVYTFHIVRTGHTNYSSIPLALNINGRTFAPQKASLSHVSSIFVTQEKYNVLESKLYLEKMLQSYGKLS